MKKYSIHKEGLGSIIIACILLALVIIGVCCFDGSLVWEISVLLIFSALFFMVVWFFRIPYRDIQLNEDRILCPADGKIVHVRKVFEQEYFRKECMQISVFMSPLNIHVNRYPISGVVSYFRYHPGKYLVAWHPKSSLKNERTTVVIETSRKKEVLVRQIAGAVARRIVYYAKNGEPAAQGEELGFIKFGSRVDVFLPLEANIFVKEGQKVKGGIDFLAEL